MRLDYYIYILVSVYKIFFATDSHLTSHVTNTLANRFSEKKKNVKRKTNTMLSLTKAILGISIFPFHAVEKEC